MTLTTPGKKPEYLSKTHLKREFGLTDGQIRSLGEPDKIQPNPHYRTGPPMQLGLRERVQQWIAEHQNDITASRPRRQAAQKAVHTKRVSAKAEIVSGARARQEAAEFFWERYVDFNGEVTEKGLCSYIRHNYTNHEEILSVIRGRSELPSWI